MAALSYNTEKPRTRSEIEAKKTQAFVIIEKEYLGRGPLDLRTIYIKDRVLIRLKE
jgi:uncharacterized protein YbcI